LVRDDGERTMLFDLDMTTQRLGLERTMATRPSSS
jgi:hypothetical protein